MKAFSKPYHLFFILAVTLLFGTDNHLSTILTAAAQGGVTVSEDRPFRLPFDAPPGPDTWLMAQPYGNTTGAYRQRFTTYGLSGGIHFGVDLSAPCGTEVVAIADGIVFAIDGPFGSPPHNLMIDHPQLGYASMYGHLLQAPNLKPGDVVKAGQVVALSGDSAELCYRRPHLHLEIRDLNHVRKYNPMMLVDANWDNLALTGDSGRDFARDLEEPRKWQTLYDQPEARTGGPIINDFANPWPPDWEKEIVISRLSALSQTEFIDDELATIPSVGRQITRGDCCTNPYWNSDSTEVRFIDQPATNAPVGIWGVDVTRPEITVDLVTERLGLYSPDGTIIVYPDPVKEVAVFERLADGESWEIDTGGRGLNFMPDSQHIVWESYDEDAPRDTREETLWLADVDGSNARSIFSGRRTSPITWLSDNVLLMSRGFPHTSDQELFTLDIDTGRQTSLLTGPRMRDLAFSPDKRYLVHTVTFEPDRSENGIWLIDLDNPQADPQKLPFFGAYRWRDNNNLIYVPFDPAATTHNFFEYNVSTGETETLFPGGTNLIIANNDWRVSPDGQKISLVATGGAQLNGIWVLDLDQN